MYATWLNMVSSRNVTIDLCRNCAQRWRYTT